MKNRFLGVGLAVVAMGAALAVPKTVHADGDVDVALFSGVTNGLTPVEFVGGSGNYGFATGAPLGCTGVSSDGSAGGCAINSNGTYQNVVCGTGTATGSAVISENEGGSDTVNYTIVFAGTVGVIVTPSTAGPHVLGVVQISSTGIGTPSADGLPVVGDGDLADITSLPGGDGILGDCVTQFTVISAAAILPV